MNRSRVLFFAVIILSLLILSCDNDNVLSLTDEVSSSISDDVITVNQWINENMPIYYLWANEIPDIDYTQENDPVAYFYKLLYTDEDKWSWITDDYAALNAEFEGNPVSMGYDPSFYLFNGGSSVFIVINYVYPDSPAEAAGLERGDIILSINDTDLDTTNYYDLYSGEIYSAQLGIISGSTIGYTGESVDLVATTISNDPIIYHGILNIGDKKIGYLVYVEFVAGTDDEFLSDMDDVFAEFKSEGISDLIVDLRYNPGGEIDAATHLASEIAPGGVVANEDVLVNMQYNEMWQDYFESSNLRYADYLSCNFKNMPTNINMQNIYFLTTGSTASASELLISGLSPYMNVVQIGEPTYGKYTGAWVIPDDDEEWAMVPIVCKYSNIDGYTDFVNGLAPDYEISDSPLHSVPFGDTSDPMLAQAIELISGEGTTIAMTKSASLQKYNRVLAPDKKILKRNLIVPAFKSE